MDSQAVVNCIVYRVLLVPITNLAPQDAVSIIVDAFVGRVDETGCLPAHSACVVLRLTFDFESTFAESNVSSPRGGC